MTDLPTLKSIQTRIREAKGASRELDAEIFAAFYARAHSASIDRVQTGIEEILRVHIGRRVVSDFPNFTTDPEGLGACVALMRETLPGRGRSRDVFGYFWIHVDLGTIHSRRIAGEKLANDCLTFIDAICSALIAQMEAREGVK